MPTDTHHRGYLMDATTGTPAAVPMALSGFPSEIEGQPVEYRRKEICRAGRVVKDIEGKPFPITRDRLDKWVRNFKRMDDAGLKIPIPTKHFGYSSADNRGFIVGMERQGDNLYAVEQLIGADAILDVSRNDQSVLIEHETSDDQGNIYDEAITHVALTPCPQITGLNGFAKVAASRGSAINAVILTASNNRSFSMNAELSKKLRTKLGAGDDVTDERLAEMVGEKYLTDSSTVETQAAALSRITQERDTAVAMSKQHAPLADADLPRFADLATREINLAVAEGDLPAPIAEQLKTAVMVDGKPNAVALSRSPATGNAQPYEWVLGLFKGKKLGKATDGTAKTGVQDAVALDRQNHGNAGDAGKADDAATAKAAKEQGEAWKNERLAERGLKA